MKRLEGMTMRRRELIAGLASAVAWPVVARAQQAANTGDPNSPFEAGPLIRSHAR